MSIVVGAELGSFDRVKCSIINVVNRKPDRYISLSEDAFFTKFQDANEKRFD